MKSLQILSTSAKLIGILSLVIASQAKRLSLNLHKTLSKNHDGSDLYDVKAQMTFGSGIRSSHPSIFTTQVIIGSPPQKFNVQVSTGTSNSWVLSTKCSSVACRHRHRFDTTLSKTLNKTNTLFIAPSLDHHYGNRNSKTYHSRLFGAVVHDKLDISGEQLPIDYNQDFGVIIHGSEAGLENALLEDENVDGVLGLGFDRSSETGTPFFLNLVDQGVLTENIFSLYYKKSSFRGDEGGSNGGTLSLGFIDSSHFIGDIQWHEITLSRQGGWAIELTAFALRREAFEIDGNAVIDSGFPFIALTRFQAEMINAQIGGVETSPGSGRYELPCKNIPSLFEFIILFGLEEYQLEGKDYVFDSLQKEDEFGSRICQSAIVGMDFSKESDVIAIFGQVFLQKYYSAYDYQSQRVGFALGK